MGANESVKTKDFRKVLIAWGLEKRIQKAVMKVGQRKACFVQ
jgi:hypothetical protein